MSAPAAPVVTLDSHQVQIVAALVAALQNLDWAYEGSTALPTWPVTDAELREVWAHARAVLAVASRT